MTILLTGAAGFIASHVLQKYLEVGYKVIALDNLSSGRRSKIPEGVEFVELDVTDPSFESVVEKYKPDVINHHGAQIVVTDSVKDPINDAKINILGTINVAKASIKYKVKQLIFASSGGAIYGGENLPATEDSTPAPISPYGLSKWSAEQYLKYFSLSFKLPVTILRYSNVYGPGQDTSRESGVVAIFTSYLLKGESPTIYGDGSNTRDYVFVKDVAQANLTVLAHPEYGIFNISTNTRTSTKRIYDMMTKILNLSNPPRFAPARIGEQEHSQIAYDKAKMTLGWEPNVSLEWGLTQTIEWYKQT